MTAEERKRYMKTYRQMRHERCQCEACGNVDEETKAGATRCRKCAAKRALSDNERYEHRKTEQALLQKARYNRLKAEHRCVGCGKQLPEGDGGVRCLACAVRQSEFTERRRRR